MNKALVVLGLGLLVGTAWANVPDGVQLAEKQHLTKNNGAEPQTLDPQLASGVPGANIIFDLFEGLTDEAPDGSIVPGVAKSWDISKDQLTYTFHLRQDAKWNNGKPVTAQDFVYGMQRLVDPKVASDYAYFLYPLVNGEDIATGKIKDISQLGVHAKDRYTLVVELSKPTPYLLDVMSQPPTYPAYKPAIEKHGSQWTKPGNMVSNGAYNLKEWVVNGHITLVKNDQYWDAKNTTITQVKYLPISNTNTVGQMFKAGQVDYTYFVPNFNLKTLQEKYGKDVVHIAPQGGTYYYLFNMIKPPFGIGKDEKITDAEKAKRHALRKALTMAVNRDALTNNVLGQGQLPIYQLIPPKTKNGGEYRYSWADWNQEKRNAEAKKLFAQSGYSKDNPLEFVLAYNTSGEHRKIALAVSSMWQQVFGADAIKPKLYNEEWKVFLADRQQAKYPMARDGWVGDYNEASTYTTLMTCGSGENDAKYCSAKYDQLVKQAAGATTSEQRIKFNEQSQQIMLQDYPIIPLFQYVTKHLVKTYVGGFTENLLGHYKTKNWYIKKH